MDIFFLALLLALLFTFLIPYNYRGERAPGALFLFFLLLFLPVWAMSLWLPPFGPVFLGIAWLVPLLTTFVILGLIAAGSSGRYFERPLTVREELREREIQRQDAKVATGLITVLVLVLAVAIFFGHGHQWETIAHMGH